jgi:hypothetical protein
MTELHILILQSCPTEAAFLRIIERVPAMSEPDTGAPAPAPPAARKDGPNPLDYIMVVGGLLIVGGVVLGLFVATDIKLTLPIIASIASAIISAVIAGYAGYRWGASQSTDRTPPPAQ